jgi:outer membrane receptor for monomeric catechols
VANRASSRLKNQDYRHGFVAQGDFVIRYGWRNWSDASTMLGWAYTKTDSISDAYSGVPDPPFNTLNLTAIKASGYSADFYGARRVSNLPRTTYTGTSSYGIVKYIQQDIGLWRERLILSGGIRGDRDNLETTNLITQRLNTGTDTTLNSFRYGAIFKVVPKVAVYAMKSVQNDPTRVVQRYSRLLAGDPRLNETFTVSPDTQLQEIGVKGEVLGGRLTITADYWEMERAGTTVAVTSVGLSQGQMVSINENREVAGARSRGYELSAFGSINDRLSVIANYTRMSTRQQRAGGAPGELSALPFAPGWNANLFAKYSFRDRRENGWAVKGGIAVIGPYYHMVTGFTDLTLIPKRQESVDVGVAYRWKNYEFDVTINNLTNDPFMITRDQAPRTYRFSVATRF